MLEDLVFKLQKEMNGFDFSKMKSDINMTLQNINIFVKKDDYSKFVEEMRKLKQ